MLLTALVLALIPAHDEQVVGVDVKISGREIQLLVHAGMDRLRRGMKFPAGPEDLTELQLMSVKADVARTVLAGLKIEVDGVAVGPEPEVLEPQFEKSAGLGDDFIASVLQGFTIRREAPPGSVTLTFGWFDEMPGTRVVVKVLWDGERVIFHRRTPEPLRLEAGRLRPTAWGTAVDFALWGMLHIFAGFDHIAFLLALLLGARRLREMIAVVSSFTVAHSLTLLLAAFEIVSIQPRVTEALIAASIIYVAVENVFAKRADQRWILTFGFGLVHGLGFSGVLRGYLKGVDSLVLPVLSFNAGVELGQLAIMAVVFPLLQGLRRRREEQPTSKPWPFVAGSAVIGVFGLAWLLDRVFALDLMPI